MADSEESDSSHIKLHQINTFSQGSLVKTSYQPKGGGTTAVIVSSATTHLQTTSTQVSRISTLPIQAGPAASYHVPRGAAAVANMAAPRSSVATPVLRGSPLPLSIGTRAVLPTGVQAPRQSAKIPAHHVGPMRGRGVTVATGKQQQVVSGRLLGPTLVAASRPPHSTILTSTVLTKPVMLSSSSMVRAGLQTHSMASTKPYHQTDQSTSTGKLYQQMDQSTSTTAKLYQTDQSTSTTTKLYQPTDGTTVKVYQSADQPGTVTAKLYHHPDQSTPTSAKIYGSSSDQPGQSQTQQQPIYLHHKPHIVGGGMYVSQTGGSSGGSAGGVVVASGMAQTHGAVVMPHGAVTAQHGATVLQAHSQSSHGTVMAQHVTVAQQHGTAAVLQAQPHSQQHAATVQTHASLVQQHGGVVHSGVAHGGVHQPTHTATLQSGGSQASYIEISRQMVRPANPQSQAAATSTSIHQQSTVSQVMRFNPVVVVEAGRPQPFQSLLSASGASGGGGESATLTALPPGVAQSLVQPLSQSIAVSPAQPPASSSSSTLHHPLVSVAQQVSVSTGIGQITTHSTAHVTPPQSLAVGSLTVSSIPQSLSTAVAQSLTPKQNTSPRPSILRKRDPDSWSSSMKAQRNLVPVLSSLSVVSPTPGSAGGGGGGGLSVGSSSLVQTPVTPQSQTLSVGEDDAPPGSGGSSTLSAASSPDATPMEQPSPVASVSAAVTATVTAAAAAVAASSSPRKKPRKQQLPHNPPPSRPSPFSDEDMQFLSDKPHSNSKPADLCVEEEKKKRMSLLKSYKQGWKPTQNHFMRYCDVRSKQDSKPTLTELANQKNALHLINGWKIYHLLAQIEDMVNTETEYCGLFTSLLSTMEEKQQKIRNKNPDKKTDELLSRLNERIKANAQRCKVVNDHMNESKGQFMKLFEHKTYVADLINRFANKRSVKKRERI